LAADRDALAGGLDALAAGDPAAAGDTVTAEARPDSRLAVLFTGQGSQRIGAGRELAARFPVFAEALDTVLSAFDPELQRPLREILRRTTDGTTPDETAAALLDDTAYAQPAIFAVEVALYRLVTSLGVTPGHLLGHSVGEIAAAHVAGVLALDDAATLVAARGRLMAALPTGGAMVAVQATEAEVEALLDGYRDRVSVAAVNGPSAVVLSGADEAVTAVAGLLADQGRRTRRLRVSHAFHSPLMEPMLDEFRAVVEGLDLQAPLIPIVSDVTGELATVAQLTSADYWVEHVRSAVRFADGVDWLARHDVTAFLELGPDGPLSAMTRDCLDAADPGAPASVAVPALRAGRPEEHTLTAALAALHTHGTAVDWAPWFAGTGARRTDLPTYAFRRRRFWPKALQTGAADLRSAGLGAARHPLLSATVSLADSEGALLTGRLSLQTHPWLADHTVRGTTLLPGTAFLELAVRAGDEVGCDRVEELTLAAPLALPDEGGVAVQLWVGAPDAGGRRTLTVYARPDTDADAEHDVPWTPHATGVLAAGGAVPATPDATEWPPAGAEPLGVEDLYDRLAQAGFGYGPAFRGLTAAWRHDHAVLAEIVLPEAGRTDVDAFGLHPAALDAALHAAGFVELGERSRGGMPFSWEGVTLHASGAGTLRVRLTPVADDAIAVAVADGTGAPVVTVDSLVLRGVGELDLDSAGAVARDALFRLDWTPVTPAGEVPGSVVIAGDDVLGLATHPGLGAAHGGVAGPTDLATLVTADGPAPDVVLLGLAGGAEAAQAHRCAADALAAVRTWLDHADRLDGSRLVVVTRGATTGDDVAAAAAWGL
ncbi:acyltransferase domain-containing protein, partial [Pseudonocardia sp. SID8383]